MNQFAKLKKQKRQMAQMMQLQEKLAHIEAVGVSGGGRVTVKVNGEKEVTSLKISPECLDPNDPEGVEDLVVDALKKAYADLETKVKGLPTPSLF